MILCYYYYTVIIIIIWLLLEYMKEARLRWLTGLRNPRTLIGDIESKGKKGSTIITGFGNRKSGSDMSKGGQKKERWKERDFPFVVLSFRDATARKNKDHKAKRQKRNRSRQAMWTSTKGANGRWRKSTKFFDDEDEVEMMMEECWCVVCESE